MTSFPSLNPNPPRCRCSSSTVAASQPSLLVFSGGTAFNDVVQDLITFTTRVTHVISVSDDGDSTAEIVRVLGGPAVRDIRLRCLRLADQSTAKVVAFRQLLGHRLPIDARQANSNRSGVRLWNEITRGGVEF